MIETQNHATPSVPITPWQPPVASAFEIRTISSAFIDSMFTSRTLLDIDGNERSLDTYIPAEQGELLYSLIQYLKPQRTLEVGLANGVSALYIATALRDLGQGRHIAIDPYQRTDWRSVGWVSLSRASLQDFVTLDERPSHWAIPDLDEWGHKIQFAFIDGSHLMDYVMSDFMSIDRILDVGGLIAFDDSDWPAVNQVIRFALTNCSYEVFPTGVVIEPKLERPRLAARCLRAMVRRSRALQRVVRSDFLDPPSKLGIEGRCVVLRKTSIDTRHSLLGQLIAY